MLESLYIVLIVLTHLDNETELPEVHSIIQSPATFSTQEKCEQFLVKHLEEDAQFIRETDPPYGYPNQGYVKLKSSFGGMMIEKFCVEVFIPIEGDPFHDHDSE